MSARGRGKAKTAFDEHLTKPEVARACMRLIDPNFALGRAPERYAQVLEPSAGRGRFIEALRDVHGTDFHVDAAELQARYRDHLRRVLRDFPSGGNVHTGRFEDLMQRNGTGYDLIVGNPPYDAAEVHVRHALYHLAPGGRLAFLLRFQFRAGQKRRDLFRRFPLFRCYVFEARPGFNEEDEDTDAAEYALFVWQRDYRGPEIVRSFNHAEAHLLDQDAEDIRDKDWSSANPKPR